MSEESLGIGLVVQQFPGGISRRFAEPALNAKRRTIPILRQMNRRGVPDVRDRALML